MNATDEMRVLAECLPEGDAGRSIGASGEGALDWNRLITLAAWHGMTPLLAAKLFHGTAPDHQPGPAMLENLRSRQSASLAWTLLNLRALVELQREFDRRKLRVVAWKGPSVAWLLYGSATLREWGDLDFLFLEEDLAAILQIAQGLGYELQESREHPDRRDLYLLVQKREFTFLRRRDNVVLEFHLQILPRRFGLWQDSQAHIGRAATYYPVGDTEVLIEEPGDLLVSLCAHGTKHHFDRLKWSADIAQFVSRYGISLGWELLLSMLARDQKHLVVLLGLALAQRVYGVALPQPAAERLDRLPALSQLAASVARHLMSGSMEPAPEADRKAMAALLCPRRRDRLVYNLLPLIEFNYEDLLFPVQNRPLFFLNYVFRVFRLLRKYGLQRLATKTAGSVRSVH